MTNDLSAQRRDIFMSSLNKYISCTYFAIRFSGIARIFYNYCNFRWLSLIAESPWLYVHESSRTLASLRDSQKRPPKLVCMHARAQKTHSRDNNYTRCIAINMTKCVKSVLFHANSASKIQSSFKYHQRFIKSNKKLNQWQSIKILN